MRPCRLVDCSLLLPDGLRADTSLSFDRGGIRAIGSDASRDEDEHRCHGALVVPGAIDLHCDALEKLIETRPGVRMPQHYIMPQADRLYAAAGVTTIYHAISFADHQCGVRSLDSATDIATDLGTWRDHGTVDHRLHARYEVSDSGALDPVMALIDHGQVDLLSVMDHSPGQGQFTSFADFKRFYGASYALNDVQLAELAKRKQAAADSGWKRAVDLIRYAKAHRLPVASHDDDSPQRVAFIREHGGDISEFPTNIGTARAAREAGLATVMGAPNLIRGSSQSGNMRAIEALEAGVLDCLCADYVPWTLLAAALQVPAMSALDLSAAMALVSANPAAAVGLHDRGRIAVGCRADLVCLAAVRGQPQVVSTWCGGRLAFDSRPPQQRPWPVAGEDLKHRFTETSSIGG